MSEEPKRRGRPPGAKNKKPPKLPRKSARVEARKREAKAAKPKRQAPPPVHEVQAEIVLPGERFGERSQHELPDITEGADQQLAFVWPRPRGRPEGSTLLKLDDTTLDRIWRVGWEQGNHATLAVALGVSLKTLSRFFEANPLAKDTFEDAAVAAKGRLDIQVFREAMSGSNTPALLHAHKVWGGNTVPGIPAEGGADSLKQLQRVVIEFVDAKASTP